MIKYYKAEDVTELINACEWRMTLAKERHGEGFVDYSKQVLDVDELTKRLSDLPTIEVSEDCISREYMKSLGYINKGDFNSVETIREWIDNAPSVVPKARSIEMHLDVTDDVVDRAVEQIRAEGEWVIDEPPSTGHGAIYTCPFCGHEEEVEPTNLCPACGAKMKG